MCCLFQGRLCPRAVTACDRPKDGPPQLSRCNEALPTGPQGRERRGKGGQARFQAACTVARRVNLALTGCMHAYSIPRSHTKPGISIHVHSWPPRPHVQVFIRSIGLEALHQADQKATSGSYIGFRTIHPHSMVASCTGVASDPSSSNRDSASLTHALHASIRSYAP